MKDPIETIKLTERNGKCKHKFKNKMVALRRFSRQTFPLGTTFHFSSPVVDGAQTFAFDELIKYIFTTLQYLFIAHSTQLIENIPASRLS